MRISTGHKAISLFVTTVLLAVLQGCSYLATDKRQELPEPAVSLEEFNPAGLWIYEDKLVTGEVELDDRGNGSYPWEEGYFITKGWSEVTWQGTWHQPGNDREGGFELELSDDFSFAFGRWWYTRIGDNTAPDKKGGKFTLTRI